MDEEHREKWLKHGIMPEAVDGIAGFILDGRPVDEEAFAGFCNLNTSGILGLAMCQVMDRAPGELSPGAARRLGKLSSFAARQAGKYDQAVPNAPLPASGSNGKAIIHTERVHEG